MLLIVPQILIEVFYYLKETGSLHLLHIPMVVLAVILLNIEAAIVIILLQPLFHLKGVLAAGCREVLFLSVAIYAAAIPAGIYIYSLRRKASSYEDSLDRLHSDAKDLVESSPSLNDEAIISQYISYTEDIDSDIHGILKIAERAPTADSINLFLNEKGELTFSLSSGRGGIRTTGSGLIHSVFNKREPVISYMDTVRDEIKTGYISGDRIVSFMAVPLMEHSVLLGILTADSTRYRAFDQRDLELMGLFASEAAKTIRRQRVYSQMQLYYKRLQILHAESSGLAGYIDISDVTKRIVESAEKISGARAFLLLKKAGRYDIAGNSGEVKSVRTLKNTVLQIAIDNRKFLYLSNISSEARKVAERVRSIVKNHVFAADGQKLHITVSLGIPSYPKDASTRMELIDRAD